MVSGDVDVVSDGMVAVAIMAAPFVTLATRDRPVKVVARISVA
jgi:hypothetical protein